MASGLPLKSANTATIWSTFIKSWVEPTPTCRSRQGGFPKGDEANGNQGDFSMISRRDFIRRAQTIPVWAPSIVRAGSLMTVRTRIYTRLPDRIGIYDRRLIRDAAPIIRKLQRAGWPAIAIASALNQRGPGDAIRSISAWSAEDVLRTVREADRLLSAEFAGTLAQRHRVALLLKQVS